jgi:hypothetical protein
MPDIEDCQGATLLFDGVELGTYISMSSSWSASGVHETTSKDSSVLGTGTNARVIRQYNCSSIEPGQVTVKFLGNASFKFLDTGIEGMLSISWPGGDYSGYGFVTQIDVDIVRGELVQLAMQFQFSGFY